MDKTSVPSHSQESATPSSPVIINYDNAVGNNTAIHVAYSPRNIPPDENEALYAETVRATIPEQTIRATQATICADIQKVFETQTKILSRLDQLCTDIGDIKKCIGFLANNKSNVIPFGSEL